MECTVIRDLIPLYVDGVASEDSRKLVEEHIATCDDCRALVEAGSGTTGESTALADTMSEEEPTEIDFLQSLKKKLRHQKVITAVVACLAVALAIGTGLGVASIPYGIPFSSGISVSQQFTLESGRPAVEAGTPSIGVKIPDSEKVVAATIQIGESVHPKATAKSTQRTVLSYGVSTTLIYVGFSVRPIDKVSSSQDQWTNSTVVWLYWLGPIDENAQDTSVEEISGPVEMYYVDDLPRNAMKISDNDYLSLRNGATLLWSGTVAE